MKHLSLRALASAVLLAAGARTAAPAHALTQAEFDSARGRYQLSDGRTVHLGGTARRPRLEWDDEEAVVLGADREGRTRSPDGRVELQLISLDNGVVSGLRLIQRR